eukprot:IDg15208t1
MRHLLALDVSARRCKRSGQTICINRLPEALAECKMLRELRVRRHEFPEVPPVILQLRFLRVLDLRDCQRISMLPDDMGRRLRHLRHLLISGTSIDHLPRSVLRAIDNNCFRYARPLVLTGISFANGYLRTRITHKRYPVLASKCEALFKENEGAHEAENAEESDDEDGEGDGREIAEEIAEEVIEVDPDEDLEEDPEESDY